MSFRIRFDDFADGPVQSDAVETLPNMRPTYSVTELLGDGIGSELSRAVQSPPNEYGDFLSDMACGLAGSLGLGASANLGFDPAAVVRVALFDAAHGTAPDIAGKNLANPTAIFLALSLLLYQLGEISIGQAVKHSTLDSSCSPGVRHGFPISDVHGRSCCWSY